jgi:hypothetical protein
MSPQGNEQPDNFYPFAITFIDPLFAIALHLGFSHGLFLENWFKEWRKPTGPEVFSIGVFTLGFVTIALAWLGYHRSISRKPLRGLARFAIDVLLVMIYAAVLMKFNNFGAVLLLLSLTYLLYLFWDLAKLLEYRAEYKALTFSKCYGGVFVDLFWFVIFLALTTAYAKQYLSNGALLTCAFIACFGHRVNKVVPIWSSLATGAGRILFSGRETPQQPVRSEDKSN